MVWRFSSSKSLQKIEKLKERALRFLFTDHTSSYNDLLLELDKCTLLIAPQRIPCIEIFKTVKQLRPHFMQNIFKVRSSHYSSKNPNNLANVRPNKTTFGFGSNSLSSIGTQTWNGLQNEIKSAEKFKKFQAFDKTMEWSTIYRRITVNSHHLCCIV